MLKGHLKTVVSYIDQAHELLLKPLSDEIRSFVVMLKEVHARLIALLVEIELEDIVHVLLVVSNELSL